jgi:O-antigen/teichoic acid export membrane protein
MITILSIFRKKIIIYLFDQKYLESGIILLIVASFSALNYLTVPIGLVLQSLEKVQVLFYSKIFVIYNLVIAILVVKKYGLIGVALATCTAMLFKNIFCFYYAKKYANLNPEYRSIGKTMLNSLIMGIILFFLNGHAKDVFSLIIIIAVGFIVYLFLSYFNNAFSNQEKKFINGLLPNPLKIL